MAMPPCECCVARPIEVSVPNGYRLVHLCRPCYLKLDHRFFDPQTMKLPEQYSQPKADAIRYVELQFLETLWAMDEAKVNR